MKLELGWENNWLRDNVDAVCQRARSFSGQLGAVDRLLD
jgi:hypothetical protein